MNFVFTTRGDAIAWLGNRYDEQVRRYPRLSRIPRTKYIRRNLRAAMRMTIHAQQAH